MKLTKELEISTGHRLPNHKGGCSNLHGHNYKVIISIDFRDRINPIGNENGFYIDFGEVKKVINNNFDHQFLMYKGDPFAGDFDFPGVMNVDYVPSAENIALNMCKLIRDLLVKNLVEYKAIYIKLYETSNSFVEVSL